MYSFYLDFYDFICLMFQLIYPYIQFVLSNYMLGRSSSVTFIFDFVSNHFHTFNHDDGASFISIPSDVAADTGSNYTSELLKFYRILLKIRLIHLHALNSRILRVRYV